MEGTEKDQRFAEEVKKEKLNTGFTKDILSANLNKKDDINYFEKIPAIKRKILYILDNMENSDNKEANEITARDRIEYLKEKSWITDEKFIKEIMWKYDREKYFWTLEVKDTTKKTIVAVLKYPEALKHPNLSKEEIKKLREERKEAKKARKNRWRKKWKQTKINFEK